MGNGRRAQTQRVVNAVLGFIGAIPTCPVVTEPYMKKCGQPIERIIMLSDLHKGALIYIELCVEHHEMFAERYDEE